MCAATEHEERPLRADAARNRERILEAAAEVFAQRGLDATLDDVAHQACVGVGTVYRRFPNKEALVEALFEQAIDGIVGLALDAATFADSWEGLLWFIESATQLQAEDLGLRDVLLHGSYGHDRVARARGRIEPAVAKLVERAQLDGHLRPDVVPADFPMIEMMVGAVAEYTDGLAPELWRRYLTIVLDGLSTRGRLSVLPEAPSREVVERALMAGKFKRC
ncbi:MAG: TetR/AcrR family transcriptional regulator [Acidimicrobiales bacterium]